MKKNSIKNIAILGSTGSIGTQTLDIIREYPGLFRAHALVARRNWKLLAEQVREFKPAKVIIADQQFLTPLQEALADLSVQIMAGSSAIEELMADHDISMVVAAMVGYSGLAPTLAAARNGLDIALANKETLVAGGHLVKRAVKEGGGRLIPIDSEHSAIFQCLQGENRNEMRKIILTASGGPFRNTPLQRMPYVTVEEALRHPNWSMGAKVTIDSASMMNKGLEMIEACHLFDCTPDDIEIAVHPQSIVHSMVEYADGSIKAQLGATDMRLPIRYALGYPERLKSQKNRLKISQYSSLSFFKPDMEKFPLLTVAFDAMRKGGNAPCVMNAANEVAVDALLNHKIKFVEMVDIVNATLDKASFITAPTYSDIIDTHKEATAIAASTIKQI